MTTTLSRLSAAEFRAKHLVDDVWRTEWARGELAADAWFHSGAENTWHVHSVLVHPDHRGQGHGRAVMEMILTYSDLSGRDTELRVRADNEPAIRLYRSLGYVVAADPGEMTNWHGNPLIYMVRKAL